MSLDQCRRTVEKIGKARELLLEAVDDGQWLDWQTLSRIKGAVKEVAAAEHYAEKELGEIERRHVRPHNAGVYTPSEAR